MRLQFVIDIHSEGATAERNPPLEGTPGAYLPGASAAATKNAHDSLEVFSGRGADGSMGAPACQPLAYRPI